jgi:Lrp/AsnC family transcriptional regulator
MPIDSTDRKILKLLQEDASLSVAEIAERVNLTSTPCWRRIQKLENEGYVRRRVALLDREKLGLGITVLIAVRTNQHSVEWLERFHNAVSNMPEVVDFLRLSGEIDYMIRVVVPDIRTFDSFYKRLIGQVELYDVSSMFAMEEIKTTTELPLDYLAVRR